MMISISLEEVEVYKAVKHKYNMMDAQNFVWDYAEDNDVCDLVEELEENTNIYDYLATEFEGKCDMEIPHGTLWRYIVEDFFEHLDY